MFFLGATKKKCSIWVIKGYKYINGYRSTKDINID